MNPAWPRPRPVNSRGLSSTCLIPMTPQIIPATARGTPKKGPHRKTIEAMPMASEATQSGLFLATGTPG